MKHSEHFEKSHPHRHHHMAGRGRASGGRHGKGFGFGRGFGDGQGGDGAGGFGRKRGLYDSEELRLVLLSLIAEHPRHGYDLIRALDERTASLYVPSPGVIYPTLTMLQDMGLIAETESGGTRKIYAATEDGIAYLAQHKEEVTALLARINELRAHQKGDHAPVKRAVMNLRSALHQKLAQLEDEETTFRIAQLLDEVTQKIERL